MLSISLPCGRKAQYSDGPLVISLLWKSGQMPSVIIMTQHILRYTWTKQLCFSPSLPGDKNKDIQRLCPILSTYNCVHLFLLRRNMPTGGEFLGLSKVIYLQHLLEMHFTSMIFFQLYTKNNDLGKMILYLKLIFWK